MHADSDIEIKELRVDGGASVNDTLMQFQADVLDSVTIRPKIIETTALGAAYLAGLAVGFWDSKEQIQEMWEEDKRFEPVDDKSKVEDGIQGWYKAIKALEYWTTL